MYKDADNGELKPTLGRGGAAFVTLVDQSGNPVSGFGSGSGSGGTAGGALETTQLQVLDELVAIDNLITSLLPTLADGAYSTTCETTIADVYYVNVAGGGLAVGDLVSRRTTPSGATTWWRETTVPGAVTPPNVNNLTLIAESLIAQETMFRTPAGQTTSIQTREKIYPLVPPYGQPSDTGWV